MGEDYEHDAQRAHIGESYREGEDYVDGSYEDQKLYDAIYEAPPIRGPATEGEYDRAPLAPFPFYPWRPVGSHLESILPLHGRLRYRRLPPRTHLNPEAGWKSGSVEERQKLWAEMSRGSCPCPECSSRHPQSERDGKSLYSEERKLEQKLARHLDGWTPEKAHRAWSGENRKGRPLVFQYPWESEGYELGYSRSLDRAMRSNRGAFSVSWEENEDQEREHYRDTWDSPTVLERTWRASGNRPGPPVRGETDLAQALSRFAAHLNGHEPGVVLRLFKKDGPKSKPEREAYRMGEVAIVALALEGFNTRTIARVVGCAPRTIQRVIDRAKKARPRPL